MRIEFRWHGRGGQGTVTAAEILAAAAIKSGYYAQAFPEFGAERRGAPVKAYTRIDKSFIYEKTPITEPDYIIVLDSSLVLTPEVYKGIKENGKVIANTAKKPEELREAVGKGNVKIYTLNATKIALEYLGVPIVNTAMVGATLALLKIIPLDRVFEVVKERFPEKVAEANIKAIKKAFNETLK